MVKSKSVKLRDLEELEGIFVAMGAKRDPLDPNMWVLPSDNKMRENLDMALAHLVVASTIKVPK